MLLALIESRKDISGIIVDEPTGRILPLPQLRSGATRNSTGRQSEQRDRGDHPPRRVPSAV